MSELLDMLGMPTTARRSGHVIGWRLGKSVGYEEFLARVQAWRTRLNRTSGQAFALYLSDSVEFASALFGAWEAGKTIYLPGDTLPGTCASLRETVHGYLGEFASEWNPIMPASQDEMGHTDAFDRLTSDFVGLVLFTSGSTGAAQAIPKKMAQMSQEVATLEALFGNLLRAADIITTVSHQHIYGLLFNVLWPLTAGRAIHARSFYFPQELRAVLAERDGVLVSSPAHLKRLPEHSVRTMTANRLRAVFSSGGPLPFEVACEAERLLGVVPIEVYGSSETGGIAWRQQRTRTDEVWMPMPGVTCRIHPGKGVLEVRSPHLFDQNWFRTADRATFVGDNRFLITGRVDRIVKLEEKRISLTAIECQLMASSMVSDARVLVVEGNRPRIAAFVVPSVIGRGKLAEIGKLAFNRLLRDRLSQSIEPAGIPRVWRYIDSLPMNLQGKTTHAELIALFDSESARPTLPLERLIERDTQRAVFEFTAPRDLVYFSGHFRDLPILAGVVQIDWVIAYGRKCFDLPSGFRGICALKFQRIIAPEKPFTLELVHEPGKSSLSFKITSRVGTHSSGRLLFGAADV
jgi:acyl-CoA synthetase (AMP-forming)/AMP-acid ligase II/3-hydroxymyristoyl/3-hydroxydecanoyl-(acyl carrier protein) dehydratase